MLNYLDILFLQVVPLQHEHKCRAVLVARTGARYNVLVAAVPVGETVHRMSNELCVTLPLDCSEIVLPPANLRSNNTDIYREFLEVRDGNTDLSSVGKLSGCSVDIVHDACLYDRCTEMFYMSIPNWTSKTLYKYFTILLVDK